MFYAGEEQIPHIEASARANTSVFVTNTTSSIVSFFFNPVFHSASGEVVTDIPNLKYTANFSSSNNPLSGAGANMSPNTIGIIDYQKNNSFFLGYAEILWDSSTCFDTPPLVTTVGQNIGSTTSYYYVNDGNNW